MNRQHGILTTRQAYALGIHEEEWQRWIRRGDLVRLRRGVAIRGEVWGELDHWRGQPLACARAAHYSLTLPHVMSHDSAALELGIPLLRVPQLAHITRPDVRGSRSEFGIKHHRAVFNDAQVLDVGGIAVLDAARTVADIAREHGLQAGVIAGDAVLFAGGRRVDLERAYAMMRNWRNVRTVRRAVELADAGAESPGESRLRLLLIVLGFWPIETQFEISDGRRTARCDLRVGRHVIEFDGKVKYTRASGGGVLSADTDVSEVVWREKQRQDWLAGFKLGVSRVVHADLAPEREQATCERLRREITATNELFGTSIADLERFVVRR